MGRSVSIMFHLHKLFITYRECLFTTVCGDVSIMTIYRYTSILHNREFLFTVFHWMLSEGIAISGFDCIQCILDSLIKSVEWEDHVGK